MKRSLLMGGLMYMLAGCAAFTPSNATDNPKNHQVVDLTPDYKEVVSDPLNGLLDPPKLSNLTLPEGSRLDEPVRQHLKNTKEYMDYLERHFKSLEEMINHDNETKEEIRKALRGKTYDCTQPAIPQIELGNSPRAEPMVEGTPADDVAKAAVRYAKELEAYNTRTLKVIEEGVALYHKECGLQQ